MDFLLVAVEVAEIHVVRTDLTDVLVVTLFGVLELEDLQLRVQCHRRRAELEFGLVDHSVVFQNLK